MNPQEQQQLFLSDLRIGPGFIGWQPPSGVFKQKAFATDQEAINLIGNHSGTANVWASMATFGPGARREAQSALHLKSFWLDVDAHGKGPYGTPDEALAGIKAFVAKAGLPKPNFVNLTGHGVQVFWALPSPISKADWQPVADDLQQLAKRLDLGADPITADAARILRVPGTLNFRDPDNPRAATLHVLKPGHTALTALSFPIECALAKPPPKRSHLKGRLSLFKRVDDTPRQAVTEPVRVALRQPTPATGGLLLELRRHRPDLRAGQNVSEQLGADCQRSVSERIP